MKYQAKERAVPWRMVIVEKSNESRRNDTAEDRSVGPSEDFKTGALNRSATLP
jgi:hypothetical protein